MNTLGKLKEYEQLLKQAAEAEIAIKLFKMRVNLESQKPQKRGSEDLSQYLLENGSWLTDKEIQFLQQPHHSPAAVARRMDVSRQTVTRLCDSGDLPHTKQNGRYRIDSLGVMEYLDNAKTKEKI